MADLEKMKKELLGASHEELMEAIKDRGRAVRCDSCQGTAYSIDTVVIYCPDCKAKTELDPYWK